MHFGKKVVSSHSKAIIPRMCKLLSAGVLDENIPAVTEVPDCFLVDSGCTGSKAGPERLQKMQLLSIQETSSRPDKSYWRRNNVSNIFGFSAICISHLIGFLPQSKHHSQLRDLSAQRFEQVVWTRHCREACSSALLFKVFFWAGEASTLCSYPSVNKLPKIESAPWNTTDQF